MAGQFMNKETLEAEALRLGVNLEGLTWPQKQGAVMAAKRREAAEDEKGITEITEESSDPIELSDMMKTLLANDTDGDCEAESLRLKKNQQWVTVKGRPDPMADMRGKRVLIAPEMAMTTNQLFGYEEELDDEVMVEEVVHDIDAAFKAGKDEVNGTYKVVGHTGKKVIAHSALPKQGAGIYFRPDKDLVPVVSFQGRSGYLWTHHRLPNIKNLLMQSGYYHEYKDRFKDEPFIWHAAGKLLVCDRALAEAVIREIEEKERNRRLQTAQTSEFIKNGMK